MTGDHLEAFVRESEESIVELNNSLLALEEDPRDREAMDRIFRTAHTLKGNFSAMGFEDTSRLAHAIEELLDEVRAGEMELTPEVVDRVFEGVDLIEAALEGIEAAGEPDTDPDATIEAIRAMIEAVPDATDATGGDSADRGEDPDGTVEEALAAVDDGAFEDAATPVVHARLRLGESEMAGVDGMLALESANDALDVLATVPDPEAVQSGEYDGGFDIFVAGDGPEAVREAVEGIGQVESATVAEVGERLDSGVESSEGGGPTDAEAGDDEESGEPGSGTDTTDDAGSGGVSRDRGPSGSEIKSVRVGVDELDELYGLVEQLVTSRIKLRRAVEAGDVATASENLDELDKIGSNLQGTVMDMRLIPLSKAVNTFPRMVRDLARDQDKEVDFEMEGTDVELDRTILDEISDPLMHVLRNAVDHGIEPPSEREAAGKDREGEIRLRATRDREQVDISVVDAGGGLDVEAIRRKARERGVRSEAELEAMADDEVYDLIFHPGFSTTDEVTDVSGRGVGMDVVHSTVSRLDGSVSVASEPGEGTTVTLRLPVTVAIVRVLLVEVAGEEYGIPIKNIDEITRFEGAETVNGDEAISHAGSVYPVIRLREAVADAPRDDDRGMLLRIREDERRAALRCDAVTRQEEVVIKSLEGQLTDVEGLAGTAVVGDGNVVPILDVATL